MATRPHAQATRTHAREKLIPTDQVIEILKRYRAGYRVKELADAFDVSPSAVSRLVNGHTYRRIHEAMADASDLPPLNRVRSKAGDREVAPELSRQYAQTYKRLSGGG